ncbi:MAG: hypothetical protein HYV16_16720 [Gammaproteobacteria bacterium]|nr:hypothetical protein [Gammaproteobacteria bacterium]
MGEWLIIVGVLGLGLAASWALMSLLVHKAARAELMAERLPLMAARRRSAALAMHLVLPSVWLAGSDALSPPDHPES